jgi:hypothetical protein
MEENNVKEIIEAMEDIKNQRMLSYVDCFGVTATQGESKSFYFKDNITNIVFNNVTITREIGFRYIELKGRKIYLVDKAYEEKSTIEIDVEKGYINILPVEGKDDTIEIQYVEFRKDQVEFNPVKLPLYPYYGLTIKPEIHNNTFIYTITVDIIMSPADEEPFKVEYIQPLLSSGIDGIIDTAIELYNNVLSRDFSVFFNMKKIKVMMDDVVEMEILDHQYNNKTFLAKDAADNVMQLPFLYYFNGMVVPDNTTPIFEEVENKEE